MSSGAFLAFPSFNHGLAQESTFRQRFGIDASKVVLGYSNLDVTEIYAEHDLARAA